MKGRLQALLLASLAIILIAVNFYSGSSPSHDQAESESILFGKITEDPLIVTLQLPDHELHSGNSFEIHGTVTRLDEPVIGAAVNYRLVSSTGQVILEGRLKTASAGEYSTVLRIPEDVPSGVYDLAVTAIFELHTGSEKASIRILSSIPESEKQGPAEREPQYLFSLSIIGLLIVAVIALMIGRLVKTYNRLMNERATSSEWKPS